jgi:hypothetical protein
MFEALSLGMLGSLLQELLHWYRLRFELSDEKYRRVLSSARYWIITGLMIVGSGVCTAIWFGDVKFDKVGSKDLLIFGAAFPLIFKKVVEVVESKEDAKTRLGANDISSIFKTYILMR